MQNANQKTISKPISFQGVGLHSGVNSNIKIIPAKENFGIKFCRTDIESNNLIEANYQNVVEPILCTKIKNKSGTTVSTVEHLMAAFFGEGIDNALVEIDSSEVPILDGSANEFVEEIRKVGVKKQSEPRKFIKVLNKVEVKDGSKYISIEPLENDLIVDFEIIYESPLIRTRRQEFRLSDTDLTDIYCSRTFCLYEDIDFIKSQGLAKGGTLENAIVVKGNEILNEDGLRNRHEFVNHKILDCLGDIYLAGYRMVGKITSSQGGHNVTNQGLRELFKNNDNFTIVELKEKNIPHSFLVKNTLKYIA